MTAPDPIAGLHCTGLGFRYKRPYTITDAGRKVITGPDQTSYWPLCVCHLRRRRAAGHECRWLSHMGTTVTAQSGRKGSLAYADLTALGNYPIPNRTGGAAYQVDKLVGWRNYATTQPSNIFPRLAILRRTSRAALRRQRIFYNLRNK